LYKKRNDDVTKYGTVNPANWVPHVGTPTWGRDLARVLT